MEYNLAIAVLAIMVGGMASQWLAWRLRLPPIMLLFATGLLAGPVFGLIHPSHDFGPALRLAIGLAVAVVMFEGGLALDLRELRSTSGGVLRLAAIALPFNAGLGAIAAYALTPMGWGPAALFGAIAVVTGPTAVLPLLRTTRLKHSALAGWPSSLPRRPAGSPDRLALLRRGGAGRRWAHVAAAKAMAEPVERRGLGRPPPRGQGYASRALAAEHVPLRRLVGMPVPDVGVAGRRLGARR